jgi:hypothetical protein
MTETLIGGRAGVNGKSEVRVEKNSQFAMFNLQLREARDGAGIRAFHRRGRRGFAEGAEQSPALANHFGFDVTVELVD